MVLGAGGLLAYRHGKFFGKAETIGKAPVNLTAVLPSIADDIPQNYWAEKYIVAMEDGGIMNNFNLDSTFRPTVEIQRDQLAVWIARIVAGGNDKVPPGPATPTFSDVDTAYWAYKYIEYCKSQGLISGYSDGTFRPYEKVKLSVLKTILTRMGKGTANPPGLPAGITDSSNVTREIFAAFVAYNLNLPGEGDYPSVYLQWNFPVDPNAGFDFGYEIWRLDPGATDWTLLYVEDPPEQGMEVGSDLGMFYDKSMTGGKNYTYNIYLMNRAGDYSAPATVSISVP